MIKTLNKMGIEGKYLNIIKDIYDKLSTNITIYGKKLKAFPLRSRTWWGGPLSPLLFHTVPGVLARAVMQQRDMKGIHTGNEGEKVSLFADDMIL